MLNRIGVMIVGDAFTGKSTLIKIVSNSIENLKIERINPKSIPLGVVYGFTNNITK